MRDPLDEEVGNGRRKALPRHVFGRRKWTRQSASQEARVAAVRAKVKVLHPTSRNRVESGQRHLQILRVVSFRCDEMRAAESFSLS